MNIILKYTLLGFLLVVMLFGLFFFWASSSTLKPSDYTKVITTNTSSNLKNDSIYSILTYNVGYLSGMTNNKAIDKPETLFTDNLKRIKDKLKIVNADILAIQEIDFDASRSHNINQQDSIASLGYSYVAQAINWDERYVPYPYWPLSMHFGKILSGQSVFSKYPIKFHKREVLKRVKTIPYYKDVFYLDRLAQVVKIEIGKKQVVVINVHLEAFNKNTRTQQMKEVIAIYKTYSNTYPTFLLGDFNSDPEYNNAAIDLLFKLKNTGCAAFSKQATKHTFSSGNPYERLDYIFYNTTFIDYVDGNVLSDFGEISDHFPVKMRFKFVNAQKPLLQN